MQIIPAIDIIGWKCVRLTNWNYNNKTVYSKNPLEQAKIFKEQGVSMLHIVDLDGAKLWVLSNKKLICDIKKKNNISIQVGWWIRTIKDAEFYLNNWIERIIIWTTALTNPDMIEKLIKKYSSKRIVIWLDIKDEKISINWWLKTSNENYIEFLIKMKKLWVKELIVTDINKDWTLTEPNFELIKNVINLWFNVIAAWWVSSVLSLKKLKKLKTYGAIIGKALYENKINIKDAIQSVYKNNLTKRVIPCLDIKNWRTVKWINFNDLSDAWAPVSLGKYYADNWADELVFLDITASEEKRKTVANLVSKIAKEIFIPFTVWWGIRNINDINELLKAWADKVSINTIAIKNPDLIKDSSEIFWSQCIVIAVDAKKVWNEYKVFINWWKNETDLEVISWVKKVEKLWAWEILLTSIDRDWTNEGYDIDLLK